MQRSPTIEWQVAGACNYDCSYCIQSRKYRKGKPSARQIESALQFFQSLSGQWEIKCSGGEAFAHKLFMQQIVPGLMHKTPHYISILTNFSATRRELMQFLDTTRERLKVFSASFHVEYVALKDFVQKAYWFQSMLEPHTSFVVNQVVLPGQESQAKECKMAFDEAGIRWFPQLFKTKGGVAHYDNQEMLRELIGDRPTSHSANIAPSYKGKICWAGVEYCTIDKDGEIWSCRTAKRHGEGNLGNIFSEVNLWQQPSPCPYDICPCTVPANRGMIEGIAR